MIAFCNQTCTLVSDVDTLFSLSSQHASAAPTTTPRTPPLSYSSPSPYLPLPLLLPTPIPLTLCNNSEQSTLICALHLSGCMLSCLYHYIPTIKQNIGDII